MIFAASVPGLAARDEPPQSAGFHRFSNAASRTRKSKLLLIWKSLSMPLSAPERELFLSPEQVLPLSAAIQPDAESTQAAKVHGSATREAHTISAVARLPLFCWPRRIEDHRPRFPGVCSRTFKLTTGTACSTR